jgi:hypothetical protein
MAIAGRLLATCLATGLSVLVYASGGLAIDEYSLEFQTLDVPEITQDAAARLYRQETGGWPTALRRTGAVSRICMDGLTITMLDQKEPSAEWVVILLSCSVQRSLAPNTLTFVATREVWKSCCTGIEKDPDRDP